jgi:TusA-related sulfurtransferase
MSTRHELKINAKGLSGPGPRMMVETALESNPSRFLRVVVSDESAVEDLKVYFQDRGAVVTIDQVGGDFHVLVDLKE